MSDEFQYCDGCPTNPPCARCPNKPRMRDGLPPVAVPRVRKERPPLDRSKMGFGNHTWDYIEPKDQPTDFGPPGGVPRRDFNNAFNRPHPETDVGLDIISRPGALITTTAPGLEGEWWVVKMPVFKDGHIQGWLSRKGMDDPEPELVDLVKLGIVAERYSNLYSNEIVTKRVSGGKANKDTRIALTQLTEEKY